MVAPYLSDDSEAVRAARRQLRMLNVEPPTGLVCASVSPRQDGKGRPELPGSRVGRMSPGQSEPEAAGTIGKAGTMTGSKPAIEASAWVNAQVMAEHSRSEERIERHDKYRQDPRCPATGSHPAGSAR